MSTEPGQDNMSNFDQHGSGIWDSDSECDRISAMSSMDNPAKEIDYAKGRELLALLGAHDVDWLAQQLCGGEVAADPSLTECSGTYRFGVRGETKAEELVLAPTGVYTVEIYSVDGRTTRYAGAYRVVTAGGERVVKTVDVNTQTLQEFVDAEGEVPGPIYLEPQDAVTTPAGGPATVLVFTKPDGTVHTFHRVS